MPQIKSAIKRVKIQVNANKRRAAQLSGLRAAVKKFKVARAVGAGNASDLHKVVVRALDEAASRGLVHRNKANRDKSRLAKPAK